MLGTMMLAFGTGLWLGRRRLAAMEAALTAAGQSRLAMLEDERHRAVERAAAETRRITLLLDSAAPGAALFDAQHRLLAWSRGFAALAEVAEAALHAGLPLADLVRLQPASPTRKLSRHGIEIRHRRRRPPRGAAMAAMSRTAGRPGPRAACC
ncbi:hypothetical protein [Dankookia sp. P2]|uniref:hypothetical protein n=1 Tax=Dankookia sp. P2 TaxID=3423955 RepID=UPI003D67DC09